MDIVYDDYKNGIDIYKKNPSNKNESTSKNSYQNITQFAEKQHHSNKRHYSTINQNPDDFCPKKRQRNKDIEMRCLVPSVCAGGIIGKGGSNIKDMRASFKARISLPDTDASERVFIATASIESCAEILMRILPIVNDALGGRGLKTNQNVNDRPLFKSPMSIKLLVHHSQAGCIIGPKGFKIKELREKTGAKISVTCDCHLNSTDRICNISGTCEVVSKCVEMILYLLGNTQPKGPVSNFDPGFKKTQCFNYENYNDSTLREERDVCNFKGSRKGVYDNKQSYHNKQNRNFGQQSNN